MAQAVIGKGMSPLVHGCELAHPITVLTQEVENKMLTTSVKNRDNQEVGGRLIKFPQTKTAYRIKPGSIKLAPKETLIKDLKSCESFYYLESGIVKISLPSWSGKDITLGLFGRGNFFGNSPCRHGQVIAIESTEITCLSLTQLRQKLQISTDRQFLKVFEKKLDEMSELLSIRHLDPPTQIIEHLLRMEQFSQATLNNEIPLPVWAQRELPGLTGLTIETVSRWITQFKKEKVIKVNSGKGKRQLILCKNALKNLKIFAQTF